MECDSKVKRSFDVRGHPFMTSTRNGEGLSSGGCMWMGAGDQLHVDVHTHRKLEHNDVILCSHASWHVFVPEFRLWME